MNEQGCNTAMSEESDYCDSEIEFELYSQVHYEASTNELEDTGTAHAESSKPDEEDWIDEKILSFKNTASDTAHSNEISHEPKVLERFRTESDCSEEVADWEIIKSDDSCEDDGSEDGGGGDDVKAWRVTVKDEQRVNNQILRYYSKPRLWCNNCMKEGHSTYSCRQSKKTFYCSFCGDPFHNSYQCRLSMNLGDCYNRKHRCKRCRQVGHKKKDCPDLWRQFHLTTSSGRIVLPKTPNTSPQRRSCHYCGKEGHFAHDCKKSTNDCDLVFIKPTISRYDHGYKARLYPCKEAGDGQNAQTFAKGNNRLKARLTTVKSLFKNKATRDENTNGFTTAAGNGKKSDLPQNKSKKNKKALKRKAVTKNGEVKRNALVNDKLSDNAKSLKANCPFSTGGTALQNFKTIERTQNFNVPSIFKRFEASKAKESDVSNPIIQNSVANQLFNGGAVCGIQDPSLRASDSLKMNSVSNAPKELSNKPSITRATNGVGCKKMKVLKGSVNAKKKIRLKRKNSLLRNVTSSASQDKNAVSFKNNESVMTTVECLEV